MVFAKEWFTVDESAEYLCVSRRTIYKLAAEGRLQFFTIGRERHRRFRKIDLDRVLTASGAGNDAIAVNAFRDPVLSRLWDNDRDSAYDNL
jgi:excisionase family DNA binding protein